MMKRTQISIETIVNSQPEKVWDYWTQPQHIIKWNFANDDWHCTKAENELRVGGKMNSRMEAKDGSYGFDFEGTYNEVIEQKKLTYTMPDGRVASTNFQRLGETIKVTTVFDAEEQNPVEMQQDGWQAILNNFKKYVEAK